MTTINMVDAHGKHIGAFNLYDDVYTRMVTEAAINGVSVADHIAQVIVGHAQDIIDSIEETT